MTDEPENPKVARFDTAWMRHVDRRFNRLEQKIDHLLDRTERFDERLGRIERDVREVRSDITLLENRFLTNANEMLRLLRRVDEATEFISVIYSDIPTDAAPADSAPTVPKE